MLLFYVFSRIDTKSLAKTLLLKFDNSLNDVINADENQLRDIKGVGDGVIMLFKLLKEINCRILKKDIDKNNNGINNNINNIDNTNKPTLNNISSIKKYFKYKIGNLIKEEILVLFLNNKYNLVAEEVINIGNVNESQINNSLIITKALNNASSKIILAHNHPSGDYTPSVNDIKITQDLKELLSNFGIDLVEHIVVSKHGAIGMIESGMMD